MRKESRKRLKSASYLSHQHRNMTNFANDEAENSNRRQQCDQKQNDKETAKDELPSESCEHTKVALMLVSCSD